MQTQMVSPHASRAPPGPVASSQLVASCQFLMRRTEEPEAGQKEIFTSWALSILIVLLIIALFTSYTLQTRKIQAVHETVLSIFAGTLASCKLASHLHLQIGVRGPHSARTVCRRLDQRRRCGVVDAPWASFVINCTTTSR